jgi:ribonuclease-3 family protein
MDMNLNNKQPAQAASSAQLAYLGDAVLEVLVRRQLVLNNAPHPSETALSYVTAAAQSDALERILPHLTEEEEAIYRRARNSVHANVPKRATVAQYRRATGFEALFAYLHLMGDTDRMECLFRLAYPDITGTEP